MNIIHITDIDINSNAGGMNTVIPELLVRQSKCCDRINNIMLIVRKECIVNKSHSFSVLFMKYSNLSILKKADLFVFHSVYNLKFILLFLISCKYKIPYIIVSHGGLSRVAQNKNYIKKKIFKFFFLDIFIRKSKALCFTSKEEQMNSCYLKKKYIIVPNPIEISEYSYRIESFNNDVIKFVFLSKIDFYYKGLDILFDALYSIKDKLKKLNVCFSFYGYGNSKNINISNIDKREKDVLRLIDNIKKIDLGEKIKYCGPIFGEEKMSILRNSDIYILTSRSEAMPLSITESLSVATPCLVTYGTNMATLIKENRAGWASGLDREELAHTILLAIEEYKINSLLFRKSARELYNKSMNVDIGEISIYQYEKIIKEG